MSVEAAREFLRKKGLEDRLTIMSGSTATVEEAAESIGVSAGEIAKTLSFIVSGEPILIVVEGTARVDNKKFKQTFGTKAKMIPPEDVEELTGHAPGGVCPFGVKSGVTVYFDESLKKYEHVYPAAGSGHAMLRLSVREFEQAVEPKAWVDVSKQSGEQPPEENK